MCWKEGTRWQALPLRQPTRGFAHEQRGTRSTSYTGIPSVIDPLTLASVIALRDIPHS